MNARELDLSKEERRIQQIHAQYAITASSAAPAVHIRPLDGRTRRRPITAKQYHLGAFAIFVASTMYLLMRGHSVRYQDIAMHVSHVALIPLAIFGLRSRLRRRKSAGRRGPVAKRQPL